ncbi:MAG: GGDEF domain-containing protein [Rhodocyclaceae bacterium]|nr:GGDEF domain-containing protein [Rhodocyclaceae bacterium]
MERLLQHVDIMSRQRNRGQLEAGLVDALRELAGAERACLYKLFTPPGDLMVGLAAAADATGARLLDDGVSWPEGTGSLGRFPHLHACLAHGGSFEDIEPGSSLHRHAFVIAGIGQEAFGFATLKCRAPLDAARRAIVAGLIALFRNCLALLDYSEIDTLTGLLNRKTFDEYLITILSHVANEGDAPSASRHLPRRRQPGKHTQHHWLGVIDIDHFKTINDKFGHLIGDEVLILIANLMKSAFRSQDKLFRFGGEEFVVLLKPTDLASAHAIFERYRKAIDEHLFPQVEHVTVSAGFTRIGLYDTPSIILDDADEALYFAKENGRNRVCCYEDLIDAGKLVKHQVLHTDVELF